MFIDKEHQANARRMSGLRFDAIHLSFDMVDVAVHCLHKVAEHNAVKNTTIHTGDDIQHDLFFPALRIVERTCSSLRASSINAS